MTDLYRQLLNDNKYKEIIEGLSEKEREVVEEQMKRFMETLESGLLNPLSTALGNARVSEELKKIYSKKTLGDFIKRGG